MGRVFQPGKPPSTVSHRAEPDRPRLGAGNPPRPHRSPKKPGQCGGNACDGGKESPGTSVVACRDPAPVFPGDRPWSRCGCVGTSAACERKRHGRATSCQGRLDLSPCFQRIRRSGCVMTAIRDHPPGCRRVVQPGGGPGMAADQPGACADLRGPSLGTGDGVRPDVQPALRAPGQTPAPIVCLPSSAAGSMLCNAPSGPSAAMPGPNAQACSRRSGWSCGRAAQRPVPPSSGRIGQGRPAASPGCRGSLAGHTPAACHALCFRCAWQGISRPARAEQQASACLGFSGRKAATDPSAHHTARKGCAS